MTVYAIATDATLDQADDTLIYAPVYNNAQMQVDLGDADQLTVRLQVEQGSFGSGSWRTIREWISGDAVVQYNWLHRSLNRVRLFIAAAAGGTNIATITELNGQVFELAGPGLALTMHKFDADTGSFKDTPNMVAETASFTLDATKHGNRTTTLDGSGAALAVTFPVATGSGDVYKFMSIADPGTNDLTFTCNVAGGAFLGSCHVMDDASAPTEFASDQSLDDLLTMNNGTTGGTAIGETWKFTDVGVNLWLVEAVVIGDAGEADPWSAV